MLIGDLAAPYALIRPNYRAIATLFPDVTVEEVHRDALTVTAHPVETGAAISDHAFKNPTLVEMRCGFSNSSAMTPGYVQQAYEALLALQKKREPFSIATGKKTYPKMLMREITVTTDHDTENVLMFVAVFQEVLITSTQLTSAAASAMARPQQTAPTQYSGLKSAIPYSGTLPAFAQ